MASVPDDVISTESALNQFAESARSATVLMEASQSSPLDASSPSHGESSLHDCDSKDGASCKDGAQSCKDGDANETCEDKARDMLFGWKLYFGELQEEEDGEKEGFSAERFQDKDMEYGWRKYFNELPSVERGPCERTHESRADISGGVSARDCGDVDVDYSLQGQRVKISHDARDLACNTPVMADMNRAQIPFEECRAVGTQGFARRPSDMQELVEFSRVSSAPGSSKNARAFAALKAGYLDEGLLEEEADTLARLALEAHCPIEMLTADQLGHVFKILDIACLLRCAAVCRDWCRQCRDCALWDHRSRACNWEGASGSHCSYEQEAGRLACAGAGRRGVWGGAVAETGFSRYWRLCKTRCYVWGVGEHGQLGEERLGPLSSWSCPAVMCLGREQPCAHRCACAPLFIHRNA